MNAAYSCICLRRISRKFLLFLHQVSNYTISAQCMILPVNILHHFLIPNWIVTLVDAHFVPLIEPVAQECNHCHADGILILRFFLNPLNLPLVLPGDNTQHKHTGLLYPVFLHQFNDCFPGHRHPFFPSSCTNGKPVHNSIAAERATHNDGKAGCCFGMNFDCAIIPTPVAARCRICGKYIRH